MLYIASSWRNRYYDDVISALQREHFSFYDFRNPEENNHGFHWSAIDPNWQNWNVIEYTKALKHPIAVEGYRFDAAALVMATVCILVCPAGRSAHLEFGYCIGRGMPTIIYLPEKQEPELMYKMADQFCCTIEDLIFALNELPEATKRKTK